MTELEKLKKRYNDKIKKLEREIKRLEEREDYLLEKVNKKIDTISEKEIRIELLENSKKDERQYYCDLKYLLETFIYSVFNPKEKECQT